PRRYQAFECSRPVYLRVTGKDGRRECIGPYAFIKATEGAILTHDRCLGTHAARGGFNSPADLWHEIAFLTFTRSERLMPRWPPAKRQDRSQD
ncbi:MAG: hypothetical protein ACREU6_18520, partial [Steroidobacteraceae bacterium]